jgi:hypothetical protein
MGRKRQLVKQMIESTSSGPEGEGEKGGKGAGKRGAYL